MGLKGLIKPRIQKPTLCIHWRIRSIRVGWCEGHIAEIVLSKAGDVNWPSKGTKLMSLFCLFWLLSLLLLCERLKCVCFPCSCSCSCSCVCVLYLVVVLPLLQLLFSCSYYNYYVYTLCVCFVVVVIIPFYTHLYRYFLYTFLFTSQEYCKSIF